MKKRGVVTFVFDDGYESTYQAVLPILRKYNMPAVFALPLHPEKVEATEGRRVRPWKEWLHITKDGHEIAAHSVTHVDLTSLDSMQLEKELAQPLYELNAATLVYPGGAHNNAVVTSAEKHYRAARTLTRKFNTLPPANPHRLGSYDFTQHNFSPAKANLLALWAYVTNSWLIETYHFVDEHEQEKTHTVKKSEFEKHVSFVAKLPVAVKTIKETIV